MSLTRYIPNNTALCGSSALKEASADDLRVLIALRESGSGTPSEISEATGCTLSRVCGAIEFWTMAGAVVCASESGSESLNDEHIRHDTDMKEKKAVILKKNAPAETDAKELSEKIENLGMASLIDECERIAGSTFNHSETASVVSMKEELQLEDGYIITLLSYCFNTLGKHSIKYAEKMACNLFRDGIDTFEKLNAYIRAKEIFHSKEGKLRRLFGIGDRALTKKEESCFTKWVSNFEFDEEVIRLAYDITVTSTGKAAVTYTDKILSNWKAAGCTDVVSCEAYLLEERDKAKNSPSKSRTSLTKNQSKKDITTSSNKGSFDTDDFFKKALERSYGKKNQ